MTSYTEKMKAGRGVELDIYADTLGSKMVILGCSANSLGVTVHMSADEAEQLANMIMRGVQAAPHRRIARQMTCTA